MLPAVTKSLLEKVIVEVQKEENMTKVKGHIVNPLLQYCYSRLYPYFLIITIVFMLTFILALLIFIILLRQMLFDRNNLLRKIEMLLPQLKQ
tara:strand:+ start:142 stop:417 length:276 start_codon:yes stop_codon:yes gene_type:complete